MGYQLVFWKQSPGFGESPSSVYERLMDGERVVGLDELSGGGFLSRVAERFATGWERLDETNWERAVGSFSIVIGPQYFLVEAYHLPGEVLNEFIDIAATFDAKLYDPQTGVRFEG